MRYVLCLWALLTGLAAHCQDYKSAIRALPKDAPADSGRRIFKDWEDQFPKDAELYISAFNYFYNLATKEAIIMSTERPTGDAADNFMTLTDSTGAIAGYMYGAPRRDTVLFAEALGWIDKGISFFSDRLDMRFGKTFTLGKFFFFDQQADEILEILKLTQQFPLFWKWSDDRPRAEAAELVRTGIQDYLYEMFAAKESQCGNIIVISNELIQMYPKDLVNYSNVGACMAQQGDFKGAVGYFEQALALDGTDVLVLMNLAATHSNLGNKARAKEYYGRALKYADPETKQQIKSELDAL